MTSPASPGQGRQPQPHGVPRGRGPHPPSGHAREMRRLCAQGLHASAIVVGTFAVPLCGPGALRAVTGAALGIALMRDAQFKRAVRAFEDALDEATRAKPGELEWYEDELSWSNLGSGGPVPGAPRGENNPHAMVVDEVDDADVAPNSDKKRRRKSVPPTSLAEFRAHVTFHKAQCLVSLKQEDLAVEALDAIPREEHTPGGLALLGKLKHKAKLGVRSPLTLSADADGGGGSSDLALLKEALGREPMALELAFQLLDMEVDAEEVLRVMSGGGKRKIVDWVEHLVRSHGFASQRKHRDALRSFNSLAQHGFANNSHVLTQLGVLEHRIGNREAALAQFSRSRSLDPHAMDNVDLYAQILFESRDRAKLSQVTRELWHTGASTRPEPWVVAAYLAALDDPVSENRKTLPLVSRAIDLDPTHVPALQLKGSLLLKQKENEEALKLFARAFTIKRDFTNLKGLADAYMSMDQLQDALLIAKEALELMPHEPRASLLMGDVLAKKDQSLSVESLMRALRYDASNLEACFTLADVRLRQVEMARHTVTTDDLVKLAEFLERAMNARGPGKALTPQRRMTLLQQGGDDTECKWCEKHCCLHFKVAMLYAAGGDSQRSLDHYTVALSINGSCATAKRDETRIIEAMHLLASTRILVGPPGSSAGRAPQPMSTPPTAPNRLVWHATSPAFVSNGRR